MKKILNRNTPSLPKSQGGMALAISLIFMVIITIIGVSNMRSTTVNETIASNSEQKAVTFQVAESVIGLMWDTGFMMQNTPETPFNNPPAEMITNDPEGNDFTARFDNGAGVIDASGSIQYCGEDFKLVGYQLSADESSPGFVAHIYSVRGVGEITAANTYAEHDQRGYLVRPETGRSGNCP